MKWGELRNVVDISQTVFFDADDYERNGFDEMRLRNIAEVTDDMEVYEVSHASMEEEDAVVVILRGFPSFTPPVTLGSIKPLLDGSYVVLTKSELLDAHALGEDFEDEEVHDNDLDAIVLEIGVWDWYDTPCPLVVIKG